MLTSDHERAMQSKETLHKAVTRNSHRNGLFLGFALGGLGGCISGICLTLACIYALVG